MQVRYHSVQVALERDTVHVYAHVENCGEQDWADGKSFSWQIYDANADTLLEDGPRRPLLVPSSQTTEAQVEIRLPS